MPRWYLSYRCYKKALDRCSIPLLIIFVLAMLMNMSYVYNTQYKKTSEPNQYVLLKKLQECKNARAKQEPTISSTVATKPADVSKQDSENKTTRSNKVDFRLLLPFIEPSLLPHEKSLFVAVVVNTAANGEKHRTLRKTIRETWGNSTHTVKRDNNTMTWKLFFALGIAESETEHNTTVTEAQQYNDIIIGNFTDTYNNLVIKTFMSYFWAVTRLSCKYVLKTDDDVYVRVPKLMAWLNASGLPKSLYGGILGKFNDVVRNPNSPWYITEEQFNETMWPPWCHGSYTVISSEIIPRYLIFTYKLTPFHTDDAYFGLASRELGIKVVKIPGFTFESEFAKRKRSKAELKAAITIGHKVDKGDMIKYHNHYQQNP